MRAGAHADPVRGGLPRGLVEAFAPRAAGTSCSSSSRSWPGRRAGHGHPYRQQRPAASPPTSRVAIDGPTLFLQGTLIVLGIVALLLVAERSIEPGGPFVAQAAVTVGSEPTAGRPGAGATEVFPLTLFALAGMMLFVAANDLLTMFVALEVFSLPLYLLCALARRRGWSARRRR
jgi:hypothetical protein